MHSESHEFQINPGIITHFCLPATVLTRGDQNDQGVIFIPVLFLGNISSTGTRISNSAGGYKDQQHKFWKQNSESAGENALSYFKLLVWGPVYSRS